MSAAQHAAAIIAASKLWFWPMFRQFWGGLLWGLPA